MSFIRVAPSARRLLAVSLIGGALALVGLSPPSARAATPYYVDGTTGADTNDCQSALTACKTIAGGLAKAAAGDQVNVAAGTYAEHPAITKAVTLMGAGAGSTIVNPAATAAAPFSVFTVNLPAAAPNQSVEINGLTITGGFSKFGGGIALYAGNLTVTDSTIDNNTAGGLSGSTGGGGIGVVGKIFGTSETLTLNNVTVSNNKTLTFTSGTTTTAFQGAGLYSAAPVVVNGGSFTGNATAGNAFGGAVHQAKIVAADTPSLTTHGTSFTGNTSAAGGAISTLAGATAALLDHSVVDANIGTSGVGLYNAGTTTITDSSVTNNPAAFQGGGVYNAGVLNLSNATLSGNTAASVGGAILQTATSTVTATATTITGNAAPFGGADFLVEGATANLTGSTVDNNTATNSGANTTGQGGGFYNQGSLTITGGSVSRNTANSAAGLNGGNGGGILSTGTLSVTGGVRLTGNKAVPSSTGGSAATGWGGAIYVGPQAANDAPTATINDATFDGGAVASNASVGGALAVVGNVFAAAGATPAVVTGARDTINANTAVVAGGLFSAGSTTLSDATFTNNKATFEGGALDVQSTIATETPSVTLTNPTIRNNDGAVGGGGALVLPRGTLTSTGGVIDNNLGTFGAGLFNAGGTANLDGTNLTNNTANGGTTANGGSGAGAYNQGALSLRGLTVSGNRAIPNSLGASGSNNATGWGGGIYAGASAATAAVSTVVDRVTLSDNHASTASAVVAYSTGGGTNTFSMVNSTVSGNATAPGAGSLVLVNNATVAASTIANNTAATGTGGIYVTAATTVSGSIISGNGAACGINGAFVAPTDGGYNLVDPADTSCGFSAANHDLAANPQLGPLANNGGPTQTHLPAATSPAINAIPAGTAGLCVAGGVDQRGVTRPDGSGCDIGAVEVGLVAPTITGPNDITFASGTTASFGYATTAVPAPAHISISGTLPNGVTFVDNGDGTATIAGNPAAGTGGTYMVTLTATNGVSPDGTLAVTIHVTEPVTISGPSSAVFVAGRATSVNFTTTGFPVASVTESGALPTNVIFTPHADGTATISGNPPLAAVGSYPVTLQASNGTGPAATLSFTLIVNKPVSIATAALPNGQVGVPYSAALAASGGLAPYTWLITSGSLPAGLSLASNGAVTGTPTANSGTTTFTVRVTDSLHPAATATRAISITIDKGPTFLAVNGVVLSSGAVKTGTASATLTGGSPKQPISGKPIVFRAGSTTVCSGTTNAQGLATCSVNATNTLKVIAAGGVTASFAGDAKWAASTGKGGIVQ